jgi:hypothetical protein
MWRASTFRSRRGWRATIRVIASDDAGLVALPSGKGVAPVALIEFDCPGIAFAPALADADELHELEIKLAEQRAVLEEMTL